MNIRKRPGIWPAICLMIIITVVMNWPLQASERIEITKLYAYPNPFDNEEESVNITLLVKSPIDGLQGSVNYFIYDMNGIQVWSQKIEVALDKSTEDVDGQIKIENLWNGNNDRGQAVANGVYVVNVVVEIGGTYVKDARVLVK